MKYRRLPYRPGKNMPDSSSQKKEFSVEEKSLAKKVQKALAIIERRKVILRTDPEYNDVRKDLNDIFPVYPIAIVFAEDEQDAKKVIKVVKKFRCKLSVRSGGHSLAGFSVCDGIVLDVSRMDQITIDAENNTASIGAGCNCASISARLDFQNFHIPLGGCPTVGIAGYMMGGGYGFTSRQYGMNCDCVTAVKVLLTNGKIVSANAKENAKLFWAIRGGTGGNFGVLLQIDYALHKLDLIWGVEIAWNIENNAARAAEVVYTIQENYLKKNAAPEMGIEIVISTNQGQKTIYFLATWIGNEAGLDKAIAPLMKIDGATLMIKGEGKYSKIDNALLDGSPVIPMNAKAYSRSAYISRELTLNEWQKIMQQFITTAPTPFTMIDMECYGGRINSISADSNSFIHRNVNMNFFCHAFFNQPEDQEKSEYWLEHFFRFMQPFGNGASYQNYPNRNQKNFADAFWGAAVQKLGEIKAVYNTDDLLHFDQSIPVLQKEVSN